MLSALDAELSLAVAELDRNHGVFGVEAGLGRFEQLGVGFQEIQVAVITADHRGPTPVIVFAEEAGLGLLHAWSDVD
jgi:hypothetical protein